jgi:hypothetical protein
MYNYSTGKLCNVLSFSHQTDKQTGRCILIYVSIHFISGLVSKSTGIMRDVIPNMHKAPSISKQLKPKGGVKEKDNVAPTRYCPPAPDIPHMCVVGMIHTCIASLRIRS